MKNQFPYFTALQAKLPALISCLFLGYFQLLPSHLMAQVKIPVLLMQKQNIISRYKAEPSQPGRLFLAMDFNSPVINNPKSAILLNDKFVMKVELIYTAFQVSPDFKQPELNRKRLEELKRVAPRLFGNTAIEWAFTGQNACRNEYEAREYFHGFVITYRTPPSTLSMLEEIEGMKKLAGSDSLGRITYKVEVKERLKKRTKFSGYYEPVSKHKKEKGISYRSKSIWNRKRIMTVSYDTLRTYDSVARFDVSEFAARFISDNLRDSTLFSVMNRNSEWKNILFVVDVTGSMSPYSTQLLIWNKLNFNQRKAGYYTFFNDGDDMPDNRKRIGSTGGIYHVEATSIEAVENMAIHAMKKGGGGDIPENDIEALLSATKKFTGAGDIVLIADNFASVKDLVLLSQLKKPVHVILCGSQYGAVHVDYLNIARKTKGSVHTLEHDLTVLSAISEGGSIMIGNNHYLFSRGKFQLMIRE